MLFSTDELEEIVNSYYCERLRNGFIYLNCCVYVHVGSLTIGDTVMTSIMIKLYMILEIVEGKVPCVGDFLENTLISWQT